MKKISWDAPLFACFALLGFLSPLLAQADERPDEGALFGSEPAKPDAFASGTVVDNPLQMGGIFYQRLIVSAEKGVGTNNTPIALPLQFDGFMDARPNDRVRGYVDARLLSDATKDQFSRSTGPNSTGSFQFSSTSSAPSSLTTAATPNNPQVVLDSAWLKFDLDRTVFVTAGKQHLKWGTSRYWNPTDFLNTQKRDPLLPYDLRLGSTMAKFELPLEAKKTNISAIALFDNPQPASTIGQMGAAMRAETLLGSAEVGLDAAFRGGRNPVYGADLSAPLGPLDIYMEVALVSGSTTPTYQLLSAPVAGSDISSLYKTTNPLGPFVQVSGGLNYSFNWKDNRTATWGGEYFYNQLGYNNSSVYPVLIFTGQYQPFYTGKNYAAVYLTAEGPDSGKHTNYTFSTLGNLSDKSFISRIDFSWNVLTYMTFESYIDGHYGTPGGEFNFSLSTPPLTSQGVTIAATSIPATTMDVGLGLRISF